MNNLQVKPKIGEAIKVKDKLYLVLEIQQNRIFCREFKFTKQGQFQYYQDYNFPLTICNKPNRKDREIIDRQRIKASFEQKPYSAIRSSYLKNLVC